MTLPAVLRGTKPQRRWKHTINNERDSTKGVPKQSCSAQHNTPQAQCFLPLLPCHTPSRTPSPSNASWRSSCALLSSLLLMMLLVVSVFFFFSPPPFWPLCSIHLCLSNPTFLFWKLLSGDQRHSRSLVVSFRFSLFVFASACVLDLHCAAARNKHTRSANQHVTQEKKEHMQPQQSNAKVETKLEQM